MGTGSSIPRAAVHDAWFHIRIRSLPRPVVVVDVSAAAAGLWPVLHSTLEGLAELLVEAKRPDIAFLGGSSRVPLDEFLGNADSLHTANAGRGRVLGSLLDLLHDDWPARVVVLAARPIVDLMDWAGTPVAKRIVVVRLDPTANIAEGAFEEVDLADVESVARLVDLPAATVRIRARGALPVSWDNPRFRFDDGSLVADAMGEVRVGFRSSVERPEVAAEIVRPGAEPDALPVSPCEPPEEQPWLTVTSGELTLLDAWRGGRAAYCPTCRGEHTPGALVCPSGSWAFPTLKRFPTGEFVRVKVKMFQATVQAAGSVLSLGETAVVANGSLPTVWRFDGEWRATAEPWGPFERLGNDEFALLLPAEGRA